MFLIDENIKKLISNKAEEFGFVKIGFAKAEVLEKESVELKKWIEKDYDADMKWIEKGFEKRKDVKMILEDTKTVISLAYNYYTPFTHDENTPKISRYAWGKDYHKILKTKLKDLCKFIESINNCEPLHFIEKMVESETGEAIPNSDTKNIDNSFPIKTKFYVDDGPVMDKVWAKKAGIGWQGKHTNIINPEYGSWIFLCEIITNLNCAVFDVPIEDMCGSCRICIDACPTGAIMDEYKLDSTLCISYQSIENKGVIPEYINLNGWVFGCDICQNVCPFNRNDKPTKDTAFYPKMETFNRSLDNLNQISGKSFNNIFSDSPVKRTKYTGWKRNINRI